MSGGTSVAETLEPLVEGRYAVAMPLHTQLSAPGSEQTAFNPRRWVGTLTDPYLQRLPNWIETDRLGRNR